jgi:hypothetical protein
MTTGPARKALHAFLSDDAHDAWHDFAAEHGVSVSALLEELATELDLTRGTASDTLDTRITTVIGRARRLDVARRRRNRTKVAS